MEIFFAGIGEMGFGMASNIIRKNHSLTIWNRTHDKPHVQELINSGAVFGQLSEAYGAEYICLNLTADSAVEAVAEKLAAVSPGTVIMDFSTISPKTAVSLNEYFGKKGAFYLDCPVSGGAAGALSGTLAIMCGGSEAAFKKALPVLNMCGTTVQYMGESGLGQKAKLVNQLLTWVNQAAVCEAMVLAQDSGIDLNALYNVLSVSWGRSWMLERSVPKYIIPENYEAASGLELMVKDFNLIVQMAEDCGLSIPLGKKAKEIYDRAMDLGLAKKDPSVIIEVMKKDKE